MPFLAAIATLLLAQARPLEVEANVARVRFVNDVVPVLTKLGCNGGSCHGKSTGQNGFRLSLLGSDPALDVDSLVNEARGRRVFPAAPGLSLLLQKPTAALPHGGGKRLVVGSREYEILARWIGQGMRFEPGSEPVIKGLAMSPARQVVAPGAALQLRVVARYADDSQADVTWLTRFQSNDPAFATVDDRGRVTLGTEPGEAIVMARFGGEVALTRLTLPHQGKAPDWQAPPSTSLVDPFVFARLKSLGIPPSGPCTDAEFARRTSLDICGELPEPAEVAKLEASGDPHKRENWVDRLLDRPAYADLFAMKWSAILRNRRTLGPLSMPGTFAFHAWVRQSLAENKPYDQFVSEILTAKGNAAENPAVVWYRQAPNFEDQADDAAQLFLGVRLNCARCHHHPFERWGQDDYDAFASFFARVGRKPSDDPVTPSIFVQPAGGSHSPRALGESSEVVENDVRDPRETLVDWLKDRDNPYFARSVVNRYWKHFFGRGLVEPEDDFRASNPPSDPDLLKALADDFVAHGYDLKRLVRTLATSQAYRRSSEPNSVNANDRLAFSRFQPRRLPAELLLDAIDTVTGSAEHFAGMPAGTRAVQLPDEGFDTLGRFLDTFGRPRRETVCECERMSDASLTQSLHLLNSAEIERKIADPSGRASRWSVDRKSDSEKVTELYRVALSRVPTVEEQDVCLKHLARRREQGNVKQGFEDLIWSVINLKEFAFVD